MIDTLAKLKLMQLPAKPNNRREPRGSYWCVVCGRELIADDDGLFLHDDVPHERWMLLDGDNRPQ